MSRIKASRFACLFLKQLSRCMYVSVWNDSDELIFTSVSDLLKKKASSSTSLFLEQVSYFASLFLKRTASFLCLKKASSSTSLFLEQVSYFASLFLKQLSHCMYVSVWNESDELIFNSVSDLVKKKKRRVLRLLCLFRRRWQNLFDSAKNVVASLCCFITGQLYFFFYFQNE